MAHRGVKGRRKSFNWRRIGAKGRRKGIKRQKNVAPQALNNNGEVLKSVTEALSGDGKALNIDGEALKGDGKLKSNGEAFRAKKMPLKASPSPSYCHLMIYRRPLTPLHSPSIPICHPVIL